MKHHRCFLFTSALLVCLSASPSAHADLFASGATLQVTYEDPSTGNQMTQIVPFQPNGSASLLDGGVLSISEQTLVVNPTTEWVQFYLTTTSGGPLTFFGEDFLVNFNNIQLTEPAAWIDNYSAFTLNGQTSGDPFGGPLVQDPVTPSLGNVSNNGPYAPATGSPFDGPVFFPNPPAQYYVFATPVGAYESIWGVDPSVNGFVGGVELQAQQSFSTPEPSSLTLFATAVITGVGYFGWRRRKPAVT